MLQVAKHVVVCDHTIADVDFVGSISFPVAQTLDVLGGSDFRVIKVHPCCHVLNHMDGFAVRGAHEVGVVPLVSTQVFSMEVFRVLNG